MDLLSNRDSSAGTTGVRPAKILVADDNSNIQRMVSLALRDHGIDVVAVGNGEAAVRSMAQDKPDLILADVFMPVRSGYEVCEYVKRDRRFANIPVVLLLGAFDPLDESEVKRVGADGVLKKPFVPPDPMIALVKALLERSAHERLAPEPIPVGVGPVAYPAQPAISDREQSPFRAARTIVEPAAADEDAPEMNYPPLGHDAIDSVAPSAALHEMQASAMTETEDAEVMTRPRDAALGEPAFWHPAKPEDAPQETQDEPRYEETSLAGVIETAESSVAHDQAAASLAEIAQPEAYAEPEIAAPTELDTAQKSAATVEPQAEIDSESVASPASEHAPKNSTSWDWSTPDFPPAISDDSQAAASHENVETGLADWPPPAEEPVVELHHRAADSPFAPSSAVWSEPAANATTEESHADDSAEPAKELWQEVLPSAPAAAIEHALHVEHTEPAAPTEDATASHETPQLLVAEPALEHHADEASPSPKVHAGDEHGAASESFASDAPSPAESPAAIGEPAAPSATSDELVNAVVARVIEKLRPQMVEMINEQILRPVVSALVRRELDNK